MDITRIAKALLLKIPRKHARPTVDVAVKDYPSIAPWLYLIDDVDVNFQIPPALLRTQGAFSLTSSHPFVTCLAHGEDSLKAFYANVIPKDLAGLYGLNRLNRAGEQMPPWEIPWFYRIERKPPPGEAGLNAAEGFSLFGPVTEAKLQSELQRLKGVAASIRDNGYRPDLYGHIEGNFLTDGDRVVFYVRGGKHRAAALVHMGFANIPVRIRATWPRAIYRSDAAHWPLVSGGQMECSVAEHIFDCYLSGR